MKKSNSVLVSTPYLLWMAAFTLVPLGVVAYYALTDPSTGVFTLGNLRNLGMYLPVLWKSIAYSFVSAMICLLLGYPVAYYIAHCSETAQKFLGRSISADLRQRHHHFLFHAYCSSIFFLFPKGLNFDPAQVRPT